MNNKNHDLGELILLAIDGNISREQFQYLQRQIIEDPQAADYYQDFLVTYIGFSSYERSGISLVLPDDYTDEYNYMLVQLAKEEKKAPKLEIPQDKSERELIQKVEHEKIPRKSPTLFQIAALASAAVFLLIIVYLQLNPIEPEQVASVSDMTEAVWSDSSETAKTGMRLYTRQRPFYLKKGVVKIEYDYGAEITIEGPAEFTVESEKAICLSKGRIYTRVHEYGKGFTVKTPSSVLVDLGTEFGVDVNSAGDSELHVYHGAVVLSAGPKQSRKSRLRYFKAGQAAEVSAGSFNVRTIALQKNFWNTVEEPEVVTEPVRPAIFFEDFESLNSGSLQNQGGWGSNVVYGLSPRVVVSGLIGNRGLQGRRSGKLSGGAVNRALAVTYDPATMTQPLYVSALMEWNGADFGKTQEAMILSLNGNDRENIGGNIFFGNGNKIESRFHADIGVKLCFISNGRTVYAPENNSKGAGGGMSANTRYLCVMKLIPNTATSCTIMAGYFDVTDQPLPAEDTVTYHYSVDIDPSTLIVKGTKHRYYLSHVAIGIHSEAVTADNLMVSHNWENVQLSVGK